MSGLQVSQGGLQLPLIFPRKRSQGVYVNSAIPLEGASACGDGFDPIELAPLRDATDISRRTLSIDGPDQPRTSR